MASRKYTRYTDEFRASAIALLVAAGWPNKKGAMSVSAERLGVPIQTLSRWAKETSNPAPPSLVNERKIDLAELLDLEIRAALGEMKNTRWQANYKDLTVAAAIMIEKKQLLTGGVTERVGFAITAEDIAQSQSQIEQWREQRQQQKQLTVTSPPSKR